MTQRWALRWGYATAAQGRPLDTVDAAMLDEDYGERGHSLTSGLAWPSGSKEVQPWRI